MAFVVMILDPTFLLLAFWFERLLWFIFITMQFRFQIAIRDFLFKLLFDLIFSNRFLCARHWPICMKGLKRRIGVWSTRGFLCCFMTAGRPGLEPLRKSHSFWPREELALLYGRTRSTTSRTTKLPVPLSTPCACRVVSIRQKSQESDK
jgi:hypothetical protein